jgi:hypothetical protein
MRKILIGVVAGIVLFLGMVFVLGKISNKFDETPKGDFIGLGKSNQLTEEIKNLNQEELEEAAKEYSNLLLEILDLRESYIDSDTIKTAELVTKIDKDIASLDNNPIIDNWETMTLSLARKTCDNDNFLDFILTIALEGNKIGLVNGELIVDILTASKYWNTDHTVKFSQSLTSANKAIADINNETISSKWDEIVACDGICPDKDNLMFDIIGLIAG